MRRTFTIWRFLFACVGMMLTGFYYGRKSYEIDPPSNVLIIKVLRK